MSSHSIFSAPLPGSRIAPSKLEANIYRATMRAISHSQNLVPPVRYRSRITLLSEKNLSVLGPQEMLEAQDFRRSLNKADACKKKWRWKIPCT